MEIKMIKIAQLEGFNPLEFNVDPRAWGYRTICSDKNLIKNAKMLAEKIDGICIAIVEDELGTYVIGEDCMKGLSRKFYLFNAESSTKAEADLRAITYNTGRGALTRFWYDCWVRYAPGKIL